MNDTLLTLNTEIEALDKIIFPLQQKKELLVKQKEEIIEAEEQKVLWENRELVTQLHHAGAEYVFADLDNTDDFRECMEDDRTLHITIGKVRGCFICNQDITKAEWNKLARPIVKQFGFSWSKCF